MKIGCKFTPFAFPPGEEERTVKVKVKLAQSCPTLCNPMDYTVHRILQARILEWVAFPSFSGASQPRDQTQVSCIAGGSLPAELKGIKKENRISTTQNTHTLLDSVYVPENSVSSVHLVSHVWLFATPWTAGHQASLSITNSWSSPKLKSIESVKPSSPPPPALNLSQHQGLFKWVSCSHQVAKVLEFQLQHQSFQWTFRTDFV